MKTFRGGLPLGKQGTLLVMLALAMLILPLRVGAHGPLALVAAALGILVIPFLFAPSRIHVASDGVYLTWLLYRRFLPFATLESSSYDPGEPYRSWMSKGKAGRLTFHRRKGGPVHVSARTYASSADLALAAAEIARALDAYRGSHERLPFDVTRLSRGDAAPTAWIERLRALSTRTATFRDDAPSPDDMIRVLDDPHAAEDQRAAAAVVLSTSDPGKAHLRVAREATASPRLRIAIDAALEGDEAAITEALGEVAR